MQQHGKSFAGLLTAGLLALTPLLAQSPQGAGQDKPAGQSQSQSSQGTSSQRPGATSGQSGQSGQGQSQSGARSQPAHDQGGSANRMGADSAFVTKAAMGGMAEVKLGQLATQKASNADVKSFAQQMVDDHGKANDELKQLASKKGVTLPTDIDAKHQATYDRLSKLSGAEFDRAYMQEMVSDHRMDVNEFRRESKSGADSDVKGWAAKTLPTLEHHLQMAESTNAKVKK
jgi:putative membrane protein